jgi:uncharacterized protein (DUF952 family)
MKQTIVAIAEQNEWQKALKSGSYTKSTIDSDLTDVGFLHCSLPEQTIAIANRHFRGRQNLILLFIDPDKVDAPVKYEGALSGRPGTFPHIYGPLNCNAVHGSAPLQEDHSGAFIAPRQLLEFVNPKGHQEVTAA